MNEYFSTYLDDSFKLLYVNQTIQPMKIGLSEARISRLCRLVIAIAYGFIIYC
jgi:hypothetical protein